MIKFYDIDENYINFLKTIDNQVPDIHYNTNNKFLCGIVLSVNDINYYAPISHMTNPQRTNMLIYDGNRPISSIRFSFMIPAYDDVLYAKDFSEIAKINPDYANLLNTEYQYCVKKENEINRKAMSVYRIGCNQNHRLNYTCCNFLELENRYLDHKLLSQEAAATSEQSDQTENE